MNTGDVTINVNSTSAVHARKWQGVSALAAGDLNADVYLLATYDGTFWEFYTIGNAPLTRLPAGQKPSIPLLLLPLPVI